MLIRSGSVVTGDDRELQRRWDTAVFGLAASADPALSRHSLDRPRSGNAGAVLAEGTADGKLPARIPPLHWRPSGDRRIAVPSRRDNVLQGGLMPRQPFAFSRSPLLGDRAVKVYEWFLRALAADGDIAECGVFAGATSFEFTRYLETMKISKRVHLFDTFDGLPDIITDEERGTSEGGPLPGKFSCNLSAVSAQMESFSQYEIHPGLFSETLPPFDQPLCFIHADADLYESTLEVIGLADRCLTKEGVVVFDDYDSPYYSGVRLAIEGALDPQRYTIIPSRETTQCYAIKSSGA